MNGKVAAVALVLLSAGSVMANESVYIDIGRDKCKTIAEEEGNYLVELMRDGEPLVLLGYSKEQVEAASLAARVAGALGRPVTVA